MIYYYKGKLLQPEPYEMKSQLSEISLQVPVFVRSGRFMRTGEAWGLFILKGGVTTGIEAGNKPGWQGAAITLPALTMNTN